MLKLDLVYKQPFYFYFIEFFNPLPPVYFDPSPTLIWFYLMFQPPCLLGPPRLFGIQEYQYVLTYLFLLLILETFIKRIQV